MTIRDIDKFTNSLWDWACLDGCFGETRISLTDIDGFVERKGRFLVVETKLPGNEVPIGQKITFSSLIDTGYFTVVTVWGQPGKPEKIKIVTPKGERTYEPADINRLRDVVKKWFSYANQTPLPEFSE